jgi:hypothetical protein
LLHIKIDIYVEESADTEKVGLAALEMLSVFTMGILLFETFCFFSGRR